jgi:hypothetical protein
MAASQALADGGYSRWRIALSMNKVRTVLQETKFIQNDPELGFWRCNPPSNLYNQISCPDGTNKVSETEFEQTCVQAGLECPDGFECFCRPCIAETTCHRAAYFIAGRCLSIWLLMAGKLAQQQHDQLASHCSLCLFLQQFSFPYVLLGQLPSTGT